MTLVLVIMAALLALAAVAVAADWATAEEDFDPGITAWRQEWRS